jgi:imidazolonepropionase-like amidohydrolase
VQRSLIRVLKQNRAKILAGSDLGGIWVLPSLGLHAEFGEPAAGGLSPLEVLQATTLNGAKFLKREATMAADTNDACAFG